MNKRIALILISSLLAIGALWWVRSRSDRPALPSTNVPGPQTVTASPSNTATNAGSIDSMHADLLKKTKADEAAGLVAEWQRRLHNMPPDAASQAIREFLATKRDAPTHQGFSINADGSLKSAPTLRTFLMDELAKVDKAGAAAAAETVLKDWASPDEVSVALRNYAQGSASPTKDAFLTEKMEQLLRYEAWQSSPSAGYLEAFDVAVYLGGTKLTPALCDLARKKDNQAVAHAAYLSLDRLTLNEPVPTLELLQSQPDLMAGREQTRANFFARADVGDPNQKQVLEKYLLNPGLNGTELQTFAGLYPNANYMVSYNLLTRVNTPDGATLARKDAGALRTVNEWLADPRFEKLRPQLQTIHSRLEHFVKPPN